MGKIIAFSGSNSSASINQKLVNATANIVEGHEVEVLDLRDFEAPLFGADLLANGVPQSMQDLKAKLDSADGYIISTPEHNGSMTALLKNTIDWLSILEQKLFGDKPTVFMSTSPGPRGGVSALDHLVAIMPYRGANVVGHYSLGSFGDHYNDGVLDAESTDAIKAEIRKLEEAI